MSQDKHPPHWSIRLILAAAWFAAAGWMIWAWGWWGWVAMMVAFLFVGKDILDYALQKQTDEAPERIGEGAEDTKGQ